MKKRVLNIFLICFLFISSQKAFSQLEVSLIPKLGYSFSTYKLNYPSIQHLMRSGPAAGLYFQFRPNDIFLFETGMQVTSKGSIQTAFDTFPRLELITTYADFPFLIGIQPSKDFFQLKAGLQFSNIISGHIRSEDTSRENKDLYNSWDVAAILQVDYDFDFGLNVGVRMASGITNMRRERIIFPNNAQVDEFRSFNIQILTGYTLPIILN
ncbi:PorT family protein [Hyphobacterium sp. CCMP332]|nr:PorT family protein [Hyphobacterium sp. CCMP332]